MHKSSSFLGLWESISANLERFTSPTTYLCLAKTFQYQLQLEYLSGRKERILLGCQLCTYRGR